MIRIKSRASFLLVLTLLAGFFADTLTVHAAGTTFVTNGSTSIGTFPSSLPNNSFRINTSTTNSASVTSITPAFVGPSSATLSTTTGWTQIQNGSVDDSFRQVSLGFNLTFNGTSYNSAYIGSNTYITFGSGSGNYSGLSASNPAIPGVHMCAADNSYQKVFHKLDDANTMRVRYEGTASTSGTLGSPNIVYEAVFYSGQSYFDVHMGVNSRCGGDTTAPTISSISSDKANGSYKAGEIIDIDVVFSEAVTSTGNVTVTLETGVTDRTCTFTVSNSTTGTCNYTVQAGDTSADLNVNSVSGTIRDAASNAMSNFTPSTNLAANKNIVIDTTAPTVNNVTSSLSNGSYRTGQVIPIQVVFNESVTVTGTPQLILVTGTPATTTVNYTSGSGSNTLVFNYTVAGTNSSADLDYGSTTALSLNTGTIRDTAGNNATLTLAAPGASGSLAANKALVIDNTAPTVAITSTAPSLTNTGIPVSVTFSESVTGFVVGDVSVTNGTAGSFSGSGASYSFTVTPSISGAVSISIASGIATDIAGNENTASNTINRTFDNTPPTVSVSTLVPSPTLQTPISYSAVFSEDVTGFNLSDISVTNATLGNFQAVSATVYSFDVSPIGHPTLNVDVTVSVPAGRAMDAAGNTNTVSDSGTPAYIRFDNHSPTVALTSVTSDPTNSTPIPVTVSFSEAVTGFDSSDITVTNGSVTNFSGSGTNYTFDVTPAGDGIVSVYVPESVSQDAALNQNLVSNTLSRTYDNTAPTVVLSSSAPSTISSNLISVTATFSENVTSFISGDISVTNGSVTNFSGSGLLYTFDVIASDRGTVSMVVNAAVATDIAGNSNTLSNTLTRVYDSLGPVLAEVTPVSESTTDNTPDYTFSSSEAGSILYGGSCSALTTSADVGDTTVTFATLATGTYNDCTITVTDSVSNRSNILVIRAFTILDNTPPSIVSVSSDKADGSYGEGEVIDIDIHFSKEVTSTGVVTVTLETGVTDRTCTFTVVNSTTGSCNYVVQAGDTSNDLDTVSISGSIADQALLAMVDFIPTSTLASNKALVIDGVAPTTPGTPSVTSPTNDTTPTWTWTASTDSGSGLAGTPYTITWSEDESFGGTTYSATSNTASYTHTSALSDGRWYARVTADDMLGNTSGVSVNGSVVIDTVAPVANSFSPADNAVSVNVSSPLVITFSESMQVASGNISIYKAESNSLVEAISIASGQVSGTGTDTITINPSNDFSGETEYYILIQGTALDDMAGNSYSGISSATTWNFVTADTTAPVINSIQASAEVATAHISWVTDESASSRVDYGVTTSFENSTGEVDTSPRVLSHGVTLTGLQSCRQYYYRVRSRDSLNNESISSQGVFRTNGCGAVPVTLLAQMNTSQNVVQSEKVVQKGTTASISTSYFTKDARRGSAHEEVADMQQLLKKDGVYGDAPITGFFGSVTKQAVIRFQEKYREDILVPAGQSKGTGIVGSYTRKKMNELVTQYDL